MAELYDVVILGAGPAGITAGIYSARYNRKTVVIGGEIGGTMMKGGEYENWPGDPKIKGFELGERFRKHLEEYDVPIITKNAKSIKKIKDGFEIDLGNEKITGKTLILSLGTKHRKLDIPGENELIGKGVSYCATCDGMFFKGKNHVVVIGGADSAAKSTLYLSEIVKKVTVVYRKDELRAEPIYKERIKKKDNVEIIYNSIPTEIIGKDSVEKIKIKNNSGEETELDIDGIFIEIGAVPCNEILTSLKLTQDSGCYVETNRKMETNIHGVFVAGDIAKDSLRQAITAAADGAVAAHSAHEFLQKQKGGNE